MDAIFVAIENVDKIRNSGVVDDSDVDVILEFLHLPRYFIRSGRTWGTMPETMFVEKYEYDVERVKTEFTELSRR